MRYLCLIGVCLLAGCSTRPIVNMLDLIEPGKLYPNDVPPYGGVCGNQGAILAPAPPIVMPPSGPGAVPPAVPLPPQGNPGVPPAFPTMSPPP